MCCEECSHSNDHQIECKVFKKQNVKIDSDKFNYTTFEPLYDIIFVLRALDLKNSDPAGFNLLMNLESQDEILSQRKVYKYFHR